MRAHTVFVRADHPRVAIQVEQNEFISIQTTKCGDIQLFDVIIGDLVSGKMNAVFNSTQETHLHAEVLGRFTSLSSAQWATTLNRST